MPQKIGCFIYCASSSAPKETPKSLISFEGGFAAVISSVARYFLNMESAA